MGQVRGRSLMLRVECIANRETRELLSDGLDVGKRISDACEAMGIVVRPLGYLNVMSPPLIMTEADATFVVETLGQAITQVTDELIKQG